MSVTAIAFDIDGTLYPNSSMYLNSIPFYLSHRRLISAFSFIRHEIRNVGPIEDFDSLQAEMLASELSVSQEKAADLIDRVLYGEWENIFKRIKPFDGVRDLLESLKIRGIKLGALSDFPVGNKLDYFGLDGLWDTVMASHESGRLKPAKEPFLELTRRLDCDPSQILYVGNNPKYDVTGCKQAGMMSAYIAPFWKKRNREADFQFSNYKQFAGMIDRIIS